MEVGYVVYLNSGSPPMTIARIEGENCDLIWGMESPQTKTWTLPLACLTQTEPDL